MPFTLLVLGPTNNELSERAREVGEEGGGRGEERGDDGELVENWTWGNFVRTLFPLVAVVVAAAGMATF